MPLNPVSTSDKQIANKALILLGSARRIQTFDDSDSADTADLIALWDIARRAAIVLHPFNFAITRTSLDRDPGEAAARGPAFTYTLPPDCLRWLPWSREQELWFDAVEEGGKLLADDDGPIILRYLRDEANSAAWPPLFVEMMAYTLAIEYCQAKTQLSTLRDRLSRERDDKLSEARRVDGLSSPNRVPSPSPRRSGWVGARWRGNGQFG
jgi:hypothetical protein